MLANQTWQFSELLFFAIYPLPFLCDEGCDLRDVNAYICTISCILQSIRANIISKPSVFDYSTVSLLWLAVWGAPRRQNVAHGRVVVGADGTHKRETKISKVTKTRDDNSKGPGNGEFGHRSARKMEGYAVGHEQVPIDKEKAKKAKGQVSRVCEFWI